MILGMSLVSCAPSYPTRPAEGAAAPTAEAPRLTPAPTPQAPPSPPRSPIPRPESSERDQCGAADLQRLVGHPRTEIPVPVDPRRQRVACTTCPMTEDFNPARLNFFFDADSGKIRQIRCG